MLRGPPPAGGPGAEPTWAWVVLETHPSLEWKSRAQARPVRHPSRLRAAPLRPDTHHLCKGLHGLGMRGAPSESQGAGRGPSHSALDWTEVTPGPLGAWHICTFMTWTPPPGFWGLTATLRWPRRWRDMQPLLCLGPHLGGGAPSLRAGAGGGGPRFAFQWVFMNPPAHTQKTLSVLHGRNFSFSTEARTAVIVPLNVQMFLPLPPPTTVWLVTT